MIHYFVSFSFTDDHGVYGRSRSGNGWVIRRLAWVRSRSGRRIGCYRKSWPQRWTTT